MEETRIQEHPILGSYEKGPRVTFTYDGKELAGYEGEPIAMALKANGVLVHRYTAKKHMPRGIFCAIGRCTDCVMVVDGEPNVRTCMTPLREGMKVQTQYGTSATPFDAATSSTGHAGSENGTCSTLPAHPLVSGASSASTDQQMSDPPEPTPTPAASESRTAACTDRKEPQ